MPTIQGELEKALASIFKSKSFHTLGASKTDAKVHAINQKVFLETPFEFNHIAIIRAINKKINKNIFVKKIEVIDSDFLVRNCQQKTYRYYISDNVFSPLNRRYCFFYAKKFLKDKFAEALMLFCGEHNFKNFSGLRENEYDKYQLIRKIDSITMNQIDNNNWYIEFKAKGFIRYQIRKIIGTCLAYLDDKVSKDAIIMALTGNGEKIKFIAEPSGLVLYDIIY